MSEEEKKAIEELKLLCDDILKYDSCDRYDQYSPLEKMTLVSIVLNLIEKQQKEIEEKNIAINKQSITISKQLQEIQELKEEYYSLRNRIENKIYDFDCKFNNAKRRNDNDRADYYWDLIKNFKKLLESEK